MAMFESLTEKPSRVFYKLSSRGKLSKKDVDDGLFHSEVCNPSQRTDYN